MQRHTPVFKREGAKKYTPGVRFLLPSPPGRSRERRRGETLAAGRRPPSSSTPPSPPPARADGRSPVILGDGGAFFPYSLGPTRAGVSGRRRGAGRGCDGAAAGGGGGAGAWRRRVGLGVLCSALLHLAWWWRPLVEWRLPPFGGWLMQMRGAPLLATWAADRRRAWLAPGLPRLPLEQIWRWCFLSGDGLGETPWLFSAATMPAALRRRSPS